MDTFKEDDVVAFANGKPRILRIWDTDMEVHFLHVIDSEEDTVKVSLYDTPFEFRADELIKVGNRLDTEIRADGKQYFKWITNDEDL